MLTDVCALDIKYIEGIKSLLIHSLMILFHFGVIMVQSSYF